MKVHTLGIDLAKNVFQLHGVDRKGRPVLSVGSVASSRSRSLVNWSRVSSAAKPRPAHSFGGGSSRSSVTS
jgi:hypothetical protein